MPWVKTQQIDLQIDPQQFSCVVGVPDLKAWSQSGWGKEFEEQAKNGIWMKVVETGVPGKLTCYIEFSGFPLDILADVKEWRGQYRKQQADKPPLPMHTHKDDSLFRAVRPPEEKELESLAKDFALYENAVMLGVLTRVNGTDANPMGLYFVEVAKATKESAGNERRIRIDGIKPEYRDIIQAGVNARMGQLTDPLQYAALSALAGYYEKWVYPLRSAIVSQQTENQRGFPTVIAGRVADEWRDRALKAGLTSAELDRISDIFCPRDEDTNAYDFQVMGRWTREFKDSQADGFVSDIGAGAQAKRAVNKDFWGVTVLRDMVQPQRAAPTAPGAPTVAPPPPGLPPASAATQPLREFTLLVANQQYGPYNVDLLRQYVASGQVAASAMAWAAGMSAWAPLNTLPEFAPPPPAAATLVPPPPPPVGWG
jgi:hypothetical protein